MKKPLYRLALFDLDHTLLPLDSDHGWGEFTMQIGWCDRAEFGRRNDAFFQDYLAGRLDIHDYVRFATEAVVQRGPQAAAAAHQRFMDEIIRPAIRPAAIELVRRHQQAGDVVVITSATNEFVTRPIAQALGFEHLLAVELQTGADGWYNGQIQGVPSFREGKVTRLANWLAERGSHLNHIERSVFYSDSINDLPLLEQVQKPVATNPDAHLLSIAQERGWPVLNLFS